MNRTFNPIDGPLARVLGHNQSERERLRELYSGAFKLFRNPSAHGVVGYDAADGRSIVELVNLMLGMLRRPGELPPPDMFPENVVVILDECEKTAGPGAASRLRVFIGQCLRLGLKAARAAKQWIPFKRYAQYKLAAWPQPKTYQVPIFYLTEQGADNALHFPTHSYYANIPDFDLDRLVEGLLALGFVPEGRHQEPRADLRILNSQGFLDLLYDLVTSVAEEFEEALPG